MGGNREPLHASAVGKCLLAFTDGRERETMLAGYSYEKYTSKNNHRRKNASCRTREDKKEGFAIDDNELTPDIRCVAVPIIDTRKNCLYSLGVSGANSHMTVEKMDFIIKKLTAAVKVVNGGIMKNKLAGKLAYASGDIYGGGAFLIFSLFPYELSCASSRGAARTRRNLDNPYRQDMGRSNRPCQGQAFGQNPQQVGAKKDIFFFRAYCPYFCPL